MTTAVLAFNPDRYFPTTGNGASPRITRRLVERRRADLIINCRVDEYWALVDSGVLIDLAGLPLIWHDCPLCGTRTVVGTTCPISLPCPLPGCGARAGRRRCLRPSGHEAAQLHRARVQAAERIDEDRIAAGAVFFPAPWPRPIQGNLFDLLTTN